MVSRCRHSTVSTLVLLFAGLVTTLLGTSGRVAAQGEPTGGPEVEFDTVRHGAGLTRSPADPPGNALAAGPQHLLSAANAVLDVRTLAGVPIPGGTIPLTDVFGVPLSGSCEPRLAFDERLQRFILVIRQVDPTARTSRCLVAVSKTADPTQPDPANLAANWHAFSYDIARDGSLGRERGEYPSLGYDGAAIYVSFNMYAFGSGDFTGNQLLILDKSLAAAGTQPPLTTLQNLPYLPFPFLSPQDQANFRRDDLPVLPEFKGLAFSVKPVETLGSEPLPLNQPGLLVSHAGTSSLPGLALYTILDPLGKQGIGPKLGTMTFIRPWDRGSHAAAGGVPQPPPGFQNPPPLKPGDIRLQKAVLRNGIIWTCRTLSATGQPGGRAVVRFYLIDPRQVDAQGRPLANILVDEETITDGLIHFYQPSIVPDGRGNAVAIFHGSNDSTVFPSIFFARYSALERRFSAFARSIGGTGRRAFSGPGVIADHTEAAPNVANQGQSVWVQGLLPEPNVDGPPTSDATLHAALLPALPAPEVVTLRFEAINSPLSANAHPTAPIGLRMFPDRPTPTDTLEFRTVTVKARIKPVLEGVPVHFRVFDMDDPTSDHVDLDANGTAGGDNRGDGTTTPAAGALGVLVNPPNPGPRVFTAGPDPARETTLTNVKGEAEAVLLVSRQPGNNFKVTASTGAEYSEGLALNRFTGLQIVDSTGHSLPTARAQQTPMLTVWRRVHVEVDSMTTAPEPPNAQANALLREIEIITGDGTVARTIFTSTDIVVPVDTDGDGVADTPDTSEILPAGNGRFENGSVRVGPDPGVVTGGLDGNGTRFIERNAGIAIPFTVSNPPAANATGNVVQYVARVFTLRITGGVLLAAHNGGTIDVAGTLMTIVGVDTATSEVTVAPGTAIPIRIEDDDHVNVLPRDPLTGLMSDSDTATANLFAAAYIRPIYDGGGNAANNGHTVPFMRNTESAAVYRWDSRFNNANDFWVAYVLAAFQDSFQALRADRDPDHEDASGGSTEPVVGGSLIYLETIRERGPTAVGGVGDLERRIVVHEVAHALRIVGHNDDSATPATMYSVNGIMNSTLQDGPAGADLKFIDKHLDVLRSILRPLS